MGKKQKIARIESAMTSARRALESNDVAQIEGAASELRSAILDAYEHASELGATELLRRMSARLDELVVGGLQRTLTACPCCKGTELFVSKRSGTADFGPCHLKVTLVVCRACGDVRLRCEDLAEVAGATVAASLQLFREITLPSKDPAPFR
jgi:hypothetical protein